MMVTSNALIGAKLTEIILPLRMNSSALRNIVNGTPTVDMSDPMGQSILIINL